METHRPLLAVCPDPPDDPALTAAAADLAGRLDLPPASQSQAQPWDMLLAVTTTHLELRVLRGLAAEQAAKPWWVDLTKINTWSPAGRSRRQPLARAVGLGKASEASPTVLDATAGWGEDAWVLAALGCRVLAVERNAVVAALLGDGLRRAAETQPEVAARIQLITADSGHLGAAALDLERPWDQSRGGPDVVYVDPMFPAAGRPRKSAERRPLKILRQLVGDDADAGDLFAWALRVARRRVVVKRPLRAAPIAAARPVAMHQGKSLRWDVYLPRR